MDIVWRGWHRSRWLVSMDYEICASYQSATNRTASMTELDYRPRYAPGQYHAQPYGLFSYPDDPPFVPPPLSLWERMRRGFIRCWRPVSAVMFGLTVIGVIWMALYLFTSSL